VARRFLKDQQQEPEIVAYHGLVWRGQGAKPRLQPAWDDSDLDDTVILRAQSADRLPDWLRHWNFCCAPKFDPFTEVPRRAYLLDQHPVEIVVQAAQTLCYSTGDRIVMIHPEIDPSNPPRSIPLIERASALALTNNLPGYVHGVAGCDDRKLVAFSEIDNALKVSWSQVCHDFPSALAFLSTLEHSTSQWPDLLVASRDGRLERLRYVGSEEIRKVWRQCWEKLGLTSIQKRIERAHDSLNGTQSRREATLLDVVEGVLAEADQPTPMQRQRWLKEVSELFRPEKTKQELIAGLTRLPQVLRRKAKSESLPWPFPMVAISCPP
jgi:hypothetical protein